MWGREPKDKENKEVKKVAKGLSNGMWGGDANFTQGICSRNHSSKSRGNSNNTRSRDGIWTHFSTNHGVSWSGAVDVATSLSRSIQDDEKKRRSYSMVNGHYKGSCSSSGFDSNSVPPVLSDSDGFQKLASFKRSLLKAALVAPVAVLSTTVISSITSRAYAATTDVKAPVDLLKMGWQDKNVFTAVPEAIDKINKAITTVVNFFSDLPHNIAEMSVHLMSWLYDLCATLILKTPLWIFNNEWFENTTYLFSILAIGVVSVLTTIESIKLMFTGLRKRKAQPMPFKTILKRWAIVAGIITAVPFLFQKSFEVLNKISDTLISMGSKTMDALSLPETISFFDVATLVLFDGILISSIVPVLWQNGRRFFDIMVLGVVSPLALTAWIFDPYRHLFRQWWDNVKHLSLVQVYYSLFLLILGWFIFGIPTPSAITGMIVKMLVVIGGFNRMTSPPRIVTKHLDRGGGLDEVYDTDSTTKKVKRNIKDTIDIVTRPSSAVKKVYDRVISKTKK